MMTRNADIAQEQEERLLHGSGGLYGIYQIPEDSPARDYRFMRFSHAEKYGFVPQRRDYELVYVGRIGRETTLESLYAQFNTRHPADFTGHSMSVSDVVVMNEGGKAAAYYVDSVSFRELSDFLGLEGELEADMAAYRIGDQYLAVQTTEEGYDYTFYDSGYQEIDGGVYEDTDISMKEVIDDLLEEQGLAGTERIPVDYDDLTEKADAIEQEKFRLVQEEYQNREPYLEFYAAQCDEFPDMGKYRRGRNIAEIARTYREYLDDPDSRYMGCGMGIIYRNPKDPLEDEAEACVVAREKIHGDSIACVDCMAGSPLVSEALEQLQKLFPEYAYIPPKDIRISSQPEKCLQKNLRLSRSSRQPQ